MDKVIVMLCPTAKAALENLIDHSKVHGTSGAGLSGAARRELYKALGVELHDYHAPRSTKPHKVRKREKVEKKEVDVDFSVFEEEA